MEDPEAGAGSTVVTKVVTAEDVPASAKGVSALMECALVETGGTSEDAENSEGPVDCTEVERMTEAT